MGMDAQGSMVERIRAVVDVHRGDRGALLPILHGVHAEFGYIGEEMVAVIADELNLSRADVHGVISFYSDFRREPAGRVMVRLCRAEACQSVGAERLVQHAQQVYGVRLGQTTPDGSVSLRQVFCLGNCALGPAAQINGRLHGKVTAERLDELILGAETGNP